MALGQPLARCGREPGRAGWLGRRAAVMIIVADARRGVDDAGCTGHGLYGLYGRSGACGVRVRLLPYVSSFVLRARRSHVGDKGVSGSDLRA